MTFKSVLTSATAIALVSGAASAGGLDRSGQSVASLFASGNTGSISFGQVRPSITGQDLRGGGSYDVGETYTQTTLSLTNEINDKVNWGLIIDEPFGVDLNYDSDPNTTALGGTIAQLDSTGISAAMRYRINERFSVFGGVTLQTVEANITLNGQAYRAAIGGPSSVTGAARALSASAGTTITPEALSAGLAGATTALDPVFIGAALAAGAPSALPPATLTALGRAGVQSRIDAAQAGFAGAGGYQFDMQSSKAPSYFLGAAYEIPAIALRVAGTYRFETEHNTTATESFGGVATGANPLTFVTPASFNLEAQTGIAENTLLTLNYRWADWGSVDVVPAALGSDLVNLDDTHRYAVGVARRFNESFAGSVTVSYEAEGGDLVSPLGPTDGLLGLSIGGQYTRGGMNISGGINYTRVGDATAEVGNVAVAQFSDNHVVGVGFKVDFTF